ncbi:MAG: 50S ribosomal protein L1 [Candidatus Peregrinibacteria bacterium]|nr:50S ribosomal protein L1 [Candidatus Peregrinibacteria bacterium]
MVKKHGKKYLAAKAMVTKEIYDVKEAIEMLKKTSPVKFDASVEVHAKMGIDPKKTDQNVRSTVALPHGTGKTVRVIAFVTEDKAKEAKAAGAIEAGNEELIEKILKGFLDFDVAVASPDMMKSLGKVAKILGQKGLMPNPKAGTVTPEIVKTIEQIKKGQVEFRVDKFAVIHNLFGKVSFSEKALEENFLALMKSIMDVKPASVKGTYLQKVSLATTMGPGMNVSIPSIMEALK